MLYSLGLSIAMICGVLSVNRVTFSMEDNFDSECNCDSSISSITPEDPLNDEIYYCIYNDDLAPGTYYRRFYNSEGEEADYAGYNRYSGSSNTQTRKVYSRRISYIGISSDTYTFRFESQDSSYVAASGSLYIEIMPQIKDISARASAPSSFDDYYSSADGSVGDDGSLVVEGSNDILYFASVYALLQEGQSVEVKVKGVESERESTTDKVPIEENKYLYGSALYTYASQWDNDNNLDITSYIYDSNSNIIDSKTIRVSISGHEADETQSSVSTVIATSVKPTSYSDYLDTSPNAIKDGEVLNADSLSNVIYYCSTYSDVVEGQYLSINVRGDVSHNEVGSGYVSIGQTGSGTGYCYGRSLSSFSSDNDLTIESKIYTSNKDEIDSKTIRINLSYNL